MLSFRPAQAHVIALSRGQHACLAPAGSGKTAILTERIYQALQQGIAPAQMLCLTFTNRAALNMRAQVEQRLGQLPQNLFIGNLHRYCFMRQQQQKQPAGLMQSALQQKLLQQSMHQLNYLLSQSFSYIQAEFFSCYQQFNLDATAILSFDQSQIEHAQQAIFARKAYHAWQIEKIRCLILPLLCSTSALLNLQHKQSIWQQLKCLDENIAADDIHLALACAVYVQAQYQELKHYYQVQDYDDLLLQQLIQQATAPTQQYSWLQIDEVQDLSPLHWLFIDYLKAPDAHLLLLGDVDQSIYRFLGASIEVTTQRLGQQVHHLLDNFRNPENLVDLSNAYRQAHFSKHFFIAAQVTQAADPSALIHIQREFDDQQYAAIFEILAQACHDQHTRAVLCHSNQQVQAFSQQLQQQGITHFCVTQHDLLSRPIYLDFIAFWRCLISQNDQAAWARMLWRFGNIEMHPPRHLAHLDAELAAIKLQHDLASYGLSIADFQQLPPGFDSQHELFLYLYQQQQLLFIDTETTGLNPTQDDVIQIAAFNSEQELDLYCHSQQDLSQSQKIHQISAVLLQQHAQDFSIQIKKLLDQSEPYALIAHHLHFDDQMLIENLKRYAPDVLPKYLQRIKFCSLQLMRQLYPHLSSYKLGDLLNTFQLQGINSHNALDDVKAGFNLLPMIAHKITENQQAMVGLYQRSQTCLEHFNIKFSPLFKAAQYHLSKHSFNLQALMDLFFDYVQQHLPDLYAQYEPSERKQLQDKLGRHSQLHFASLRSLSDWQKALDFYQNAKESDLITHNDYVIVSTMHRAKGLEFDQVILPDLVDRYFPSYPVIKKLHSPDPLHQQEGLHLFTEQQRLLYVAITRAKSKLIITSFRKKRSEQRYAKAHTYQITPFLAEFQSRFKAI